MAMSHMLESSDAKAWEPYFDILRKEYRFDIPKNPKNAQVWVKAQMKSSLPLNPDLVEKKGALKLAVQELKNGVGRLKEEAIRRDLKHFIRPLDEQIRALDKISVDRVRYWGPGSLSGITKALDNFVTLQMDAHEIGQKMGVPPELLWQAYSRAVSEIPIHSSFRRVSSPLFERVKQALERRGEWDHLQQYLYEFEQKYGDFSLDLDLRKEFEPTAGRTKTGLSSIQITIKPQKYEAHRIEIPFNTTKKSVEDILRDSKTWEVEVSEAIHREIEKLPKLYLKTAYQRDFGKGRSSYRAANPCRDLLTKTFQASRATEAAGHTIKLQQAERVLEAVPRN